MNTIKRFVYKMVWQNHWSKFILGNKKYEHITFKSVLDVISENLIVKHGIFSGMKYPKPKSAGSSYPPKILGSYERELSDVLENICSNEYNEIVNIGCAEGYYAVGFAMKIKDAKIYAFDIDTSALELCKEMARINNVYDRFVFGEYCDSNTLKHLPLTKALIFCDCEGYEKELFTSDLISHLAKHELLIEVHDMIDPTISIQLKSLFEKTHTIDVYTSVEDDEKVKSYSYVELEGLPFGVKKLILAERRKTIMDWYYIKPKRLVSN